MGADSVKTEQPLYSFPYSAACRGRAGRQSWRDALAFNALVGLAGLEVLELIVAAARPVDHDAIDTVALADAECDRQLGLRQVARPAFHQPRLRPAGVEDAHGGANRVAVRLGPDQAEADAAIPGDLIVAEEKGLAV